MLQEKLNAHLISVLKSRVPKGSSLVAMLTNLLCLGKEAVYRRLRGEVPFSLAEAVTIFQKLNISLDILVGSGKQQCDLVGIDLICSEHNLLDNYLGLIDSYIETFTSISSHEESEFIMAANLIPQPLYMHFPMLSLLRFYKWLYQMNRDDFGKTFKELIMPGSVLRKHREYIAATQKIGKTVYILDHMLVTCLLNDIAYFSSLQLLPPEAIATLKEELIQFLDALELTARTGILPSGNEIQIYLSDVNFEGTYSYIGNPDQSYAFLRVFTVDSFLATDPNVCRGIRDWILSLRKFSTLISQSGEMQRIQFFNTQRARVLEIK